ncbi:hypothetical protein [Microbacterium sp. GCS4]|uniref:hypothetical protein n=1 Tax=Microbacterium sp. GCS4 TaxID=1692239 RepID=UPI0006830D1D|nr:hypothetical protein [Microbacterium sp. GCS4]
MPDIEIRGGEILANLEERTITGLLIPYNEIGHTNVGQFQVEAGVITLPADPSVVSLNLDHDRYQPVGRATRVWEEPAGIMATFSLARTPEGDAALADATSPSGKRRRLSGEFKTGIKAGKATGGPLAAGALVEMGAFASAMVLAADASADDDAPVVIDANDTSGTTVAEDHTETVYTDEDGKKYTRRYDSETTETPIDGGTETTISTTITEQETTQSEEDDMTTTDVQAAKVGLNTGTPAGKTAAREPDKHEIIAAIATYRKNPFDQGSLEVLAALSDIKISGTGALPAAGVIQQNWLGRTDLGVPFVREIITLFKNGTDITAGGKKDFKFLRGTAQNPTWGDGTWAGNKTEINSGVGRTVTNESTLDRYARGADIGREFFDLPGGSEVIEAFLAELELDYYQWSDEKARALAVATAGAPIAPAAYPGVDGHDYAGAMGQLLQGILAIRRKKADGRRDIATLAIANDIAFEEMFYTPKDLIPEFVEFVVNPDGTATATGRNGGKVQVVQADTGVEDTASVIVGADYALEFDELPGGPLHVNALEIAKGGIDEAVHGYLQKMVRRAEALVHIGTADA